MKSILQALGLGTLATALIGGVVVVVSLLDHRAIKDDEPEPVESTNQPVVEEHVQLFGWEEKNQEFFEDIVEHDCEYAACFCTLYSDGKAFIEMATDRTNQEFDVTTIYPEEYENQDYLPKEYITQPGYYLNRKKGQCWSVVKVSYPSTDVFKWEAH